MEAGVSFSTAFFFSHVPKNITTVILPQVGMWFYLPWVTGMLDFGSFLSFWTQSLSAIARREENAGTSSSELSIYSSGQVGEILK